MADIAWKGCICCQGCMALQTLWWQHHKETMNSLVLELIFLDFFENFLSKSCAVARVIANFGHCHDLCLRQTNVFVAVDTSADIGIVAVDSMCKCNFKHLQKTCHRLNRRKLTSKSSSQIVFTNCLHRSSSKIAFTDRLQQLSSNIAVCLVICLLVLITRLLRIVAKGHRL